MQSFPMIDNENSSPAPHIDPQIASQQSIFIFVHDAGDYTVTPTRIKGSRAVCPRDLPTFVPLKRQAAFAFCRFLWMQLANRITCTEKTSGHLAYLFPCVRIFAPKLEVLILWSRSFAQDPSPPPSAPMGGTSRLQRPRLRDVRPQQGLELPQRRQDALGLSWRFLPEADVVFDGARHTEGRGGGFEGKPKGNPPFLEGIPFLRHTKWL